MSTTLHRLTDSPPESSLAPTLLTWHCANAAETTSLGFRLGTLLRGGDSVALCGGLGAGKTTLVQGIVAGLGSSDRVTSPTFTLVNEYTAPALVIYHVDLYRLADAVEGGSGGTAAVKAQADTLGLEDVMGASDAIVLVEWADLAETLLPDDHLLIRLEDAMGGGRTVQFQAHGHAVRAVEIITALRS